MSSIRIKRINKEEVAPVEFVDVVEDKRPVRGAALFPEIYANIFFCARKKSGKSCAIYKTIERCATTETQVIAFVSTIHRDPTWRAIEKLCQDMGVEFTGYTGLKDPVSKEDILQTIVDELEKTTGDEKEPEAASKANMGVSFGDEPSTKKKKKKPKEKAPKFIFCFDDLSGELQTPSFTNFLKMNRHFKAKNLIASQYWNDIALQARKQLDYVLLYKGLSSNDKKGLVKLEEIYNNCSLSSITFEQFLAMYRYCTAEKFHFMWIDVVNCEFRKDFSHALVPPQEEEENELPERDL